MSAGRAHRRRTARGQAARALADAEGCPAAFLGPDGHGGEMWSRGRVLFVVPGPPPDDAPAEVREGITRRRLVATAGRCPCGARPAQPHRGRLEVRHEQDCPAVTERLVAAMRRWSETGGAA